MRFLVKLQMVCITRCCEYPNSSSTTHCSTSSTHGTCEYHSLRLVYTYRQSHRFCAVLKYFQRGPMVLFTLSVKNQRYRSQKGEVDGTCKRILTELDNVRPTTADLSIARRPSIKWNEVVI